MQTNLKHATKRHFLLLTVLIANLVIISSSISSLPWNITDKWMNLGFYVTTSLFVLFVLNFSRNKLTKSDNQVKLAIPLIALAVNIIHLVFPTTGFVTNISLLITILLIITTFSISYPVMQLNRS